MYSQDSMQRISLAQELFTHLWPEADWSSPHLQRTPERFVKVLEDLTQPEDFEFTTFTTESDEMVVVSDIPFHSLCAHHILPVYGKAHVAYIPDGKLCGLSKLPRTVQAMARQLTVQEELTNDIASVLQEELEPLGVAVVLEAEHFCMSMRGVRVTGSTTTTSAMRGVFLDPMKDSRPEFLQLIGKGK